MRRLTGGLRREFKKPQGELCRDVKKACKGAGVIIAVGDVSAYELLAAGIAPALIIYDKRAERKPIPEHMLGTIEAARMPVVSVDNEAGTIQDGVWDAVRQGLRKPCKILVNGEEDLLVLPAVLLAEEGSLVFYGQPGKGIVMIKVTADKKRQMQDFFDKMEVVG